MDSVRFISIEDDDPDLLLSFALDNEETGIISLILHRCPKYEVLLDTHERGVHVTMEGEEEYEDDLLESISFKDNLVRVKSQRNEYNVDTGRVDEDEIKEMLAMLQKMNFDSSFIIDVI
jgi:uncharacterized protein YlaN (UPF0358 family)